MRRAIKWVGVAVLAVLAAGLLAAAAGYAFFRNSVPSPSGAIALQGLSQPVEVVRDREAVPHIFARTTDDLYAALGFIHAQDRLWQMELQRRSGQGRLSEIFGEATFGMDVFLRTLDLYGHAQRSFAALPPDGRAALDAYARGVNAYLTRSVGLFEPRLPPEFMILRHKPEPWTPADSMVTIKMMALQLSENMNRELLRLGMAAQGLNAAEIEDLMPVDPTDRPPPLPELAEFYPLQRPPAAQRRAFLQPALDGAIGGGASNNWVVSGARTKSGKPLLANDPHLRLGAPSLWYLAHLALQLPGGQTANGAGATLPGVPLIVLGRGDSIAWGFTNTGADVQDVFIEQINPDNPREYKTPEGWRAFDVEEMSFSIKNAGVRKVERRRTRHGPVLPGSYAGLESILSPNHVAALQWTALTDDDTTIAAGLFDPGMRSVKDYMERMKLFVVPMQSMVLADADGNIGLIAPGRVPVRKPANKVAGRAPVPGWDATYDWQGYLKFDELPMVKDPNVGAIGTANARMVDPDYPHLITYDWDADFRQQRIKELIFDRTQHDVNTMRAAQADVLSPAIRKLQPMMIAAAQAGGSVDHAVLDQLTTWDGTMPVDRAEPLIFVAWLRETIRAVYQDDLGPAFDRYFATRAPALIRLLEGRATGRDWCDDRKTPFRESCGAVLAAALNRALADLETRYGPDRSKWRWGVAHYAYGEHRPFGSVASLAKYFDIEVPSPGGNYTLNRGEMDFRAKQPFANRHASSYRAIYDFADLDRSLYIQTTGQSGNVFSPYYRSFADRWVNVDYIEIPTKRDAIEKSAIGTWKLTPH